MGWDEGGGKPGLGLRGGSYSDVVLVTKWYASRACDPRVAGSSRAILTSPEIMAKVLLTVPMTPLMSR